MKINIYETIIICKQTRVTSLTRTYCFNFYCCGGTEVQGGAHGSGDF